jgi:hypothetical protein
VSFCSNKLGVTLSPSDVCVHVNCNRILPKFDEFVSLFSQLSLKPPCIAVTKTWLKPGQAATLLIDQYTFHSVVIRHIRSSVIKYSSSILVVNKARSNVPWLTSGLLQSINTKHKLYNDYLLGKCSHQNYKIYRNNLTTLLRSAKSRYFTDFANVTQKEFSRPCGVLLIIV